MSTVHMVLNVTTDELPQIEFKAESDTWIVNGLIAVLHIIYNGKTLEEASQININDVFVKL